MTSRARHYLGLNSQGSSVSSLLHWKSHHPCSQLFILRLDSSPVCLIAYLVISAHTSLPWTLLHNVFLPPAGSHADFLIYNKYCSSAHWTLVFLLSHSPLFILCSSCSVIPAPTQRVSPPSQCNLAQLRIIVHLLKLSRPRDPNSCNKPVGLRSILHLPIAPLWPIRRVCTITSYPHAFASSNGTPGILTGREAQMLHPRPQHSWSSCAAVKCMFFSSSAPLRAPQLTEGKTFIF